MAISRPLKWDSTLGNLKEMSDADLELLSYRLRKAWAEDLYGTYTSNSARDGSATSTNGFGAIYRGSSGSASDSNHAFLLSRTDKRKNAIYTTKANNAHDNFGDNDDTFGTPSESNFDATESVRQTFYYEEYLNATPPSLPINATFNEHSYLKWDSSGYAKIESDTANLIDTVIKLANYEMMNGDEVGTLRVATSSPGSDWTDLGTFFEDTIMTWSSFDTSGGGSTTNATFKLWIRRSDSSRSDSPDNDSKYVIWNASSNRIDQINDSSDYPIISNILIPIWKRSSTFEGASGDYGFPRYKLESGAPLSSTYEKSHGTFSDTVYSSGANSHTGSNSAHLIGSTYYIARYGNGALNTNQTTHLNVYLPSGAVRT